VGAVLASGCTFHPGQAAVVNGSSISQSSVDDLVHAGCSFFEAQRAQGGGGQPATATSFLKTLFTQSLISFKIIDKAAGQLHLTVSPAVLAKATAQQSLSTVQGRDRELLRNFFTSSTRSELQLAVIGAHLKDPSVTNADNVTPAQIKDSEAYMLAFTRKQHVVINPAYGSWRNGELLGTDGSLSAAQSPAARRWLSLRTANFGNQGASVAGLPPNQVCG